MKNKLLILVLIICLVLPTFTACNDNNDKVEATLTVTDQMGNEVSIQGQPKRIVSGYYISTSACLALGLKDKLVGIETDNKARPIYQKCAEELIENAVDVGSAKNFDLESCLSAKPDLVILPKKAKDFKQALNEVGVSVIIVNPENQTLLEEMILLIGKIANKEEKANELISYYHDKLAFINDKTNSITDKPNVYMCSPSSYFRGASTSMYQSSLIELAGGKNVIVDNNGSFANVSYEQLLQYDPDVIVIPTNEKATANPSYANDLLADETLTSISAISNGKVYQMPSGFESFDSPVPSSILGALWLLNKLYPSLYSEQEFKDEVNSFYSKFYFFDANF